MLRKNLNLVMVFVQLVLQGTLSPSRVRAASTPSVAPVAAGGWHIESHSLAWKDDGTVVD